MIKIIWESLVSTEEFFKNLVIDENDRARAERYIKAKGLFYHEQIKKKLLAWTNDNEIKYSQIASYYRYDKRIRMVLYKYIAYLEEFYRAAILDAYCENTAQKFWINEIAEKLNKEVPLNVIIENLGFKELIKQMKQMPYHIKQKCNFLEKGWFNKNVCALNDLRNAVMHNKFLLMFRGFSYCYFNNKKGSSLRDNINNLISFLPENVGKQCEIDIANCVENRNTAYDTEWDLPPQAIVSLKYNEQIQKK